MARQVHLRNCKLLIIQAKYKEKFRLIHPVTVIMFHHHLILISQKLGFQAICINKAIMMQKGDHGDSTLLICGVEDNSDIIH